MRVLILADHCWRDLPGLASVKVQLQTLQPDWDIRVVDTHLFGNCVELFKPHLVLATNLHDPAKNRICDTVRRRGGLVIVHPQEGRPNTDPLMKWVTDFPTEYCDLYLSWTKELSDHLPIGLSNTVTGSPRMDFYFPPLNRLVTPKKQLCDMYGLDENKPIITVASSFPQAKFYHYGSAFLESDWKKLGRDKVSGDEKPFETARREWNDFTLFQAWLLWLVRECPEYQVVIKPHPAEDMRHWHHFAEGIGAKLMMTDYIFNLFSLSDVHVARVSCVTLPEAWVKGIPAVAVYFGEKISGATEEAYNLPLVASKGDVFTGMVRESVGDGELGIIAEAKSSYVFKWLGAMPDCASRVARAIEERLLIASPKTHSEPSVDDLVNLHRLLVDHSRQHSQPQTDHIGQYAKSCRLEDIQRWTRDIQDATNKD